MCENELERHRRAFAGRKPRGARRVQEGSRHIDVAIHFTNPEKAGSYERFARILNAQKVDYDVFASSWYPYWHGTPEDFTRALKDAARISGKEGSVRGGLLRPHLRRRRWLPKHDLARFSFFPPMAGNCSRTS
jgi:hypothetical protein